MWHYALAFLLLGCRLALSFRDVKLSTFMFVINNGYVAKMLLSQYMA